MTLPFPERVLHQHIATLGKTGAGKSSAMRLIAEHLLTKQRRLCIVDPKGDWWGLKSSADGKSAGYPVVTFGDFKEPRATDVPLNPQSGKHVAELIASGNRPCVIGFRVWMPGQLVKFWLDFAPTLFNANQGELNVMIDEIHNFAPKGKIMDPDSGKCLHWTNRIMSEGRGLGLTFFIASQRPQKVHNDTLDNCETLIAMRVAHPAARDAIKDWIDGNGDPSKGKEVLATLAQLKRGEAWAWSPENEFGPERVQFPMFETFDSFAPPQLQKKIVSSSGWSGVDLEAVKQKLAAVIAEAKANDPKELKAEIVRLKQELAKSTTGAPIVQEKIVEVPILTAEDKRSLESFSEHIGKVYSTLGGLTHDLNYCLDIVGRAIAQADQMKLQQRKAKASAPLRVLHPAKPPAKHPAARRRWDEPRAYSDHQLSAAQIRILSRLVELMGCTAQMSVRKEQLAAWAEYSPNSGGFNNYLGSLRTAGMIAYPQPAMVTISDTGRTIAEPENVPATSEEMLARARRVLSGSEGKLLEILHESRSEMTKNDLAEAEGFSPNSGGFNNYLGHMRTLGFVEYPAPGQVKCADWLYLDASHSARA